MTERPQPALPEPQNASYAEAVGKLFCSAAFVEQLGIRLDGCGPGWCESVLTFEPRHLQQDGFAHAGLQATIADHTAGGAAATLAPAGANVLAVELKVNLLRPAVGQRLRCRAEVLRAGRQLTVVESWVWAERDGTDRRAVEPKLSAKATVTIAVVQPR